MRSLSSYRKPDSNFTMGMELECFVDGDTIDKLSVGNYLGFWYVTTDRSLIDRTWDRYGREFVSMPLPLVWLKKEIKKLASKVSWTVNATCGIHIHISRKWLTEKKAKAIHKFYCQLSDENRIVLFGRGSNVYCLPGLWKDNRYNAVNAENSETFELRMFASGDSNWALYCANMADYLVRNANRLNIDAVMAAHDLFQKD